MPSWGAQDDYQQSQPFASTSKASSLPDLSFAQLDKPPASRRNGGAMNGGRGDGKGKGKLAEPAEVITLDEEDEERGEGGFEVDEEEWEQWDDGREQEHAKGTAVEQEELESLETELESIDSQIRSLRQLRSTLSNQRDVLRTTIASRQALSKSKSSSAVQKRPIGAVDYTKGTFPWSKKALKLAKDIWGVEQWRLAQEGAINATLDGKEVVAILPTGGGKSLIYQIPALLTPGTTIVITPLISLMEDQVQNLRSRDVAAETLHASTPQTEVKAILKRMLGSAGAPKGKGKKKVVIEEEEEHTEVKLVYVTPERIDKAKSFVNTLQKMYDAKLLSRFVIDEAHCVSTMGHDYRSSYLSLTKLKTLFPKVPILAVTATAPQNVIADMLKTLGLPKTTSPGNAVLPKTTVLFTAPLYRPNLRYSIVPKPASAAAVIESMVDYILDTHQGDTGIIYTLSRADSEAVAKGINAHERSRGKLRAAVYHAYIED